MTINYQNWLIHVWILLEFLIIHVIIYLQIYLSSIIDDRYTKVNIFKYK